MASYLIHAVPQRMWYVNEYLIPSLKAQGIPDESIRVWLDDKKEGNLRACMHAFESCEGDGGTWHLQDDVCVCKNFKVITESIDFGLVCGFSSERYDGPGRVGIVPRRGMWFSFPCIRIPNGYARDCAKYVFEQIIGNPVYEEYWKGGANDDWAFRTYLKQYHKDDYAINISPNVVDHVDYLLGGGTGGKRKCPVRAQYWQDQDIVEELEVKINGRTW